MRPAGKPILGTSGSEISQFFTEPNAVGRVRSAAANGEWPVLGKATLLWNDLLGRRAVIIVP